MGLFSLILGGAVLIYTVIYAITAIKPIFRYEKAGELKVLQGKIVKKTNEENKAIRGELLNLSMPCFEYNIGGENKECQSGIFYINAKIGQVADIAVDERTGEAWVIQDIPKMKKNLLLKVSTIGVVLFVLVLTEILL